jgi:hypothetical protein
MKANPTSKNYRRRLKRMAREIAFEASWREEIDIHTAARAVDPKATDLMIAAALEVAIADRYEMADSWIRTAEQFRSDAERLESLRGQTMRDKLTVLPGGAA